MGQKQKTFLETEGIKYTISIWKKKVGCWLVLNCNCEYYKKNGYHLEERQDSFSGVYKGKYELVYSVCQ